MRVEQFCVSIVGEGTVCSSSVRALLLYAVLMSIHTRYTHSTHTHLRKKSHAKHTNTDQSRKAFFMSCFVLQVFFTCIFLFAICPLPLEPLSASLYHAGKVLGHETPILAQPGCISVLGEVNMSPALDS